MCCAGHVARIWEKRKAYRILARKKKRDHFEDLDVGGRTILKWILE
jgi:hypothetical protein